MSGTSRDQGGRTENPPAEVYRLLADLENPYPETRLAALEVLASCEDHVGRAAVRDCVLDPDPSVRNAAVEWLGEIGDRAQDTRRLRTALLDPEWTVRCSAASSLGAIGGAEAFSALSKALEDPNSHVRRYAAVALVQTGVGRDRILREVLARLERERSNRAKVGLLDALYHLGRHEALEPLLGLLCMKDYLVQHQVLTSLSHLELSPEQLRQVQDALGRLMDRESNPGVLRDVEKLNQTLANRQPALKASQ